MRMVIAWRSIVSSFKRPQTGFLCWFGTNMTPISTVHSPGSSSPFRTFNIAITSPGWGKQ